jgi:Fe-S cluster assembly protein SufD
LDVPPNVELERPVVVVNALLDVGGAIFPRLVVRAGANSEVRVLEQHFSGPGGGFVAPVVELYADQAARLRYLALNQLDNDVWQIGSQVAVAERDSTVTVAAVALGGAYARTRIDARAQGRGAHVEQIAVYFGEGSQMHDFRTLQDHAGPKTTSDLLFKGAVEGHARSVYSGLIKVRKEAVGTRAFQTNRNIKLSEGAWAESVPNLDIETNDVQCSHASSVGPIDEDQRFYLESRGVAPEVAERLIVLGFFDEVLTRLPIPEVLEPLRSAVGAKLARKDQE